MDSIIFDVDGTLWNSTEIDAQAWTEYLHNVEHKDITITAQRLQELFGKPMSEIAALVFPEESPEDYSPETSGTFWQTHVRNCSPCFSRRVSRRTAPSHGRLLRSRTPGAS